ncbi:MAG: hypothetical protein H2057_04700 [Alphaproteobacteria bacterium]|nr:hypothetical protein [Alphaproteobacteria bacterium]
MKIKGVVFLALLWGSVEASHANFQDERDPARGASHIIVPAEQSAENEQDLLQSLIKDGETGIVFDENPVLRWRQLERLCHQQDLFRPEDFMALFGTHLMTPSMITALCGEKESANTQ